MAWVGEVGIKRYCYGRAGFECVFCRVFIWRGAVVSEHAITFHIPDRYGCKVKAETFVVACFEQRTGFEQTFDVEFQLWELRDHELLRCL